MNNSQLIEKQIKKAIVKIKRINDRVNKALPVEQKDGARKITATKDGYCKYCRKPISFAE